MAAVDLIALAEQKAFEASRMQALIALLAKPDAPDLVSRWHWTKRRIHGRLEWTMSNDGPVAHRAHVYTYPVGDPTRWKRWFPRLLRAVKDHWLTSRAWVEDWEKGGGGTQEA